MHDSHSWGNHWHVICSSDRSKWGLVSLTGTVGTRLTRVTKWTKYLIFAYRSGGSPQPWNFVIFPHLTDFSKTLRILSTVTKKSTVTLPAIQKITKDSSSTFKTVCFSSFLCSVVSRSRTCVGFTKKRRKTAFHANRTDFDAWMFWLLWHLKR